ncbi:MAG: hypothetical protein FWH11_06620 [Micrococcales bacterium]|nr:hypothetical protein [Micrococcales bacterium]
MSTDEERRPAADHETAHSEAGRPATIVATTTDACRVCERRDYPCPEHELDELVKMDQRWRAAAHRLPKLASGHSDPVEAPACRPWRPGPHSLAGGVLAGLCEHGVLRGSCRACARRDSFRRKVEQAADRLKASGVGSEDLGVLRRAWTGVSR